MVMWVSYKQHFLLGILLLLSLYTAFVYIPAHLTSQQQQQLYRSGVYNRGMGRGGVIGGAIGSGMAGGGGGGGHAGKGTAKSNMTEMEHTLALKRAKQDMVKKLDAMVLAHERKTQSEKGKGIQGKRAKTETAAAAADPTLVLISRNATVTSDTRGNLGHPSVVVQYPPGSNWIKDRCVSV